MRYLLLCYDDEAWAAAGETARQQAMEEAVGLAHRLKANGQYVLAAPLHAVSTATSVRVRDGKRLVTDGPFAEMLEAKDMNHAIELMSKHPGVRLGGPFEIRPVEEIPGVHPRIGKE